MGEDARSERREVGVGVLVGVREMRVVVDTLREKG